MAAMFRDVGGHALIGNDEVRPRCATSLHFLVPDRVPKPENGAQFGVQNLVLTELGSCFLRDQRSGS